MIKKILFPSYWICFAVIVSTAFAVGLIGTTAGERTREVVFSGQCSVDWNDASGKIEINCEDHKINIDATNSVVKAMMNSETVKCEIFNTPTSPIPLSSKCEF